MVKKKKTIIKKKSVKKKKSTSRSKIFTDKKILDESGKAKETLLAYLNLINETFPYDSFYADAASDETVFAVNEPDEIKMTELGVEIAHALLNCEIPKNKIKEHLKKTEPISSYPEVINKILTRIK